MPLKFWDEAFITATYLINHLPSKVIDGHTPLELLFNQKPDYTSLRSFGCACWPKLRPYNSKKLQFRSKQCVFLGYSSLQKGFKCLDVKEGRVYISRDVVFDENVFPFSSFHPNANAQLRAEVLLLPKHLLNSNGDEQLPGSVMTNMPPANPPSNGPVAVEISGNFPAQNRLFLHAISGPTGDGASPSADLPATPAAVSTSDQALDLAQSQAPQHPPVGLSPAPRAPHVEPASGSPTRSIAAGPTESKQQPTAVACGSSAAEPPAPPSNGSSASGLDGFSVVTPAAAAVASPTHPSPASTPSPQPRRVTRLQQGI